MFQAFGFIFLTRPRQSEDRICTARSYAPGDALWTSCARNIGPKFWWGDWPTMAAGNRVQPQLPYGYHALMRRIRSKALFQFFYSFGNAAPLLSEFHIGQP